jgi:nucleoside-diphosphate-sugar epimerase
VRAVVTGALGFTGRHLARRLAAERSISVVGVDLAASPPASLPLTTYLSCDIVAEGALAALVADQRPDWIFHLAGRFSGPAPAVYRANLLTVLDLLEAVRSQAPGAKVLLVGSAAEYGPVSSDRLPITEDTQCRPVTSYGRAKLAATEAALDHGRRGLHVVVVRPFNIVGAGVPTDLVVGAILDRLVLALERGDEEVRVGNLDCERDFVAVADVVDAYVRLMADDSWGRVFNLCSGCPIAIRSVVETLLSYAARPIRPVVDPALCRPDDVKVSYGSWERAHQAIGFTPVTPLEDALRAAWLSRTGDRSVL